MVCTVEAGDVPRGRVLFGDMRSRPLVHALWAARAEGTCGRLRWRSTAPGSSTYRHLWMGSGDASARSGRGRTSSGYDTVRDEKIAVPP